MVVEAAAEDTKAALVEAEDTKAAETTSAVVNKNTKDPRRQIQFTKKEG